jgi:hypothetical protein
MRIAFLIKEFDITTPLGIKYLSAILKQNKHEVCLIRFKDKDYLSQLNIYKPDVLAYSITTRHHKEAIEINKDIKAHHGVVWVNWDVFWLRSEVKRAGGRALSLSSRPPAAKGSFDVRFSPSGFMGSDFRQHAG